MHTLMFDGVISCGSVWTRDLRSISPVGFPFGPFCRLYQFFLCLWFSESILPKVVLYFFFIKRSVFASTL